VVTRCWIEEILPQQALQTNIDDQERAKLESCNVKTLPVNMKKEHVRKMRDLCTKDVQTLVAVRGLVLRASEVQPEMAQGFFRCSMCQNEVSANLQHGKICEPK